MSKMSNTIIVTLAAVLIGPVLTSVEANAACVNSERTKTSGNSFASTIMGRQCGANMSVRFQGAVNTGWLAMHGVPGNLSATYVDNNVTTNIKMQTNGNTMHVNFIHTDNNGATSLTQGNYILKFMQ